MDNRKNLGDDIPDQMAKVGKEIGKFSSNAADEIADGAAKAAHQVTKHGGEAKANLAETVKANPLASVGIAAAAGYLFGLFMRR